MGARPSKAAKCWGVRSEVDGEGAAGEFGEGGADPAEDGEDAEDGAEGGAEVAELLSYADHGYPIH